jgi:DNA/RNA endonuclease YhcR with UshA esterase domain
VSDAGVVTRMDDYLGRSARLKTGFETGRDSFAPGEVVEVTGHYRGKLEIRTPDGRIARKVRRHDVELITATEPAGGPA